MLKQSYHSEVNTPKNNVSLPFLLTNEQGSTTLMGALLLGLLTAYLFYQLLYCSYSLMKMRERADTYICYRQLTTYSKMYVEIIAGANIAIDGAAAAAALTLGALSPEAMVLIKNLQRSQDLTHVWFLQKLTFSKYCSVTQKAIIYKNLPYKTKGLVQLVRPYFLNTTTRASKWHFYLPSSLETAQKDPLSAFALKVEMRLNTSLDPLLGFTGKEVSAGPFLNSILSSGWSLSP